MLKTPSPIAPTLHQPLHSKVSNYLNDQRRTGQYCDLILQLEVSSETETDSSIFGHYCVVGAQSQLIGGSHMLQKSLQFSIHNPLKVTIRNFSCAQCLQTIVDFFYEDVVSIAKEHELHFRKLAKMLAVTELLNLFEMQEEGVSQTEATLGLCDGGPDKEMAGALLVHGICGELTERQNDINITTENIFDDQRSYFKLKNPRAASSSNKINYCIGCDFKCYRVQEMLSHMSTCEASHLTCSLCEVGFLGWREYDAHLRKHTSDAKKPFFCLECDIRFMTRAALMVHHPKHSIETPHLCPHCGKGFKWKQGLSSHLLVHNKEKQMLCDVCGYSTTHMKALKSHKLQHNGEFFKCTYAGCQHRANRKENLKLHIETHKQERPFVCEVCGCKFSQSKNLKRHALKHSAEDIRKYKCQLCTFCSHRSDKLREHVQRVHTEREVQLELPEVVENSFENNPEDEFNLPMLMSPLATTNQLSDQPNTEEQLVTKKVRKKKEPKLVAAQRRPVRLAPKPIIKT